MRIARLGIAFGNLKPHQVVEKAPGGACGVSDFLPISPEVGHKTAAGLHRTANGPVKPPDVLEIKNLAIDLLTGSHYDEYMCPVWPRVSPYLRPGSATNFGFCETEGFCFNTFNGDRFGACHDVVRGLKCKRGQQWHVLGQRVDKRRLSRRRQSWRRGLYLGRTDGSNAQLLGRLDARGR